MNKVPPLISGEVLAGYAKPYDYAFKATESASATAVLNGEAISGAGSVTSTYETSPTSRTLKIAIAGNLDVWSVVIEGRDLAGNSRTETKSVTGGAAGVDTNNAYWAVDKVSWSGAASSGTIDVGINDEFGLPAPVVGAPCILQQLVGGVTDAGTVTFASAGANDDPNGTWTPVTWTGEKLFQICYMILKQVV